MLNAAGCRVLANFPQIGPSVGGRSFGIVRKWLADLDANLMLSTATFQPFRLDD